MGYRGLFVGLITLDLIYRVAQLPQANQKIVALDTVLAAGGPATNAAVAFSHLGNRATVLGVLGCHPLRSLISTDLENCGVAIADLQPTHTAPPPTSSILVTAATGERAVVSLKAVKSQATVDQIPAGILQGIDVVLIDGHQMAVGEAIATQARTLNIPVVVDGGSWKPGFEAVLKQADYGVCSANFFPPGCETEAAVLAYLNTLGIPHLAITHGGQPITYCDRGETGTLPVPTIQAVDTLGAGDIFHGALCHYLLPARRTAAAFPAALSEAAAIAARACQSFGTRQWLTQRHSS
ncbi:MAG: PfkB family carbohydrate kinase [Synechococcales bacterium]|nr:PfkB family carbohydrate kinase [Synechococcales bacterium]